MNRPTLVVAGVSVRPLAESARQGGWQVIGLDCFGDLDTRRACVQWSPIGEPAAQAIDRHRLRAALAAAAGQTGVEGWVAGGGFEGTPELLEAGGDDLPLLGMGVQTVSKVRDARRFFDTLDRLGLAHPTVAFEPPTDPDGWLAKRAGGCGGLHIRPASLAGPAHADTYYQRVVNGVPMSALFLADGTRSRLVALNQLSVQAQGDLAHVYGGAIGPLPQPALRARIELALDALVPAFALRGLASLDFIAAQGVPWLLEINPRPSASMVLHAHAWPEGLVKAHVDALHGRLPQTTPLPFPGMRGTRIVFAPQACRADVERLARTSYCHDLSTGTACFTRGEPVCSVSAEAADAHAVDILLRQRCAAVMALLLLIEHEEIPS